MREPYSFAPLVGEYAFIARKEGYDDNVTIINIETQTTKQVNFTLRNGTCHADCTDSNGYCNPACEGLVFKTGPLPTDTNTCNLIHSLCYNRPEGYIARRTEGETTYEYTCCEGPERSYSTISVGAQGEMENLYHAEYKVILGGQTVDLNILVWK